jgi:hypothetical protein
MITWKVLCSIKRAEKCFRLIFTASSAFETFTATLHALHSLFAVAINHVEIITKSLASLGEMSQLDGTEPCENNFLILIFPSLSFSFCRPLFTEVQLINPSRAALVPVLPLSPENSQNNISNAPHPADIHPAYRIPYMQLLHTLHNATSPQSSLHGKSQSDFSSLARIIKSDAFHLNPKEPISRRRISRIQVPWVFHTH